MTVPRPNPAGRFNPEALFRPESVAVFGAETERGAQILANLSMGGFKGRIEVAPRAADVTTGTHLAVLALPPDQVLGTLSELPARGCFAAIVPGAVEGGVEALAAACRQSGVRALGPHSFGTAVSAIGLNATLAHLPAPPGRVALVSQSAALTRAVIDWAAPNGIGFSQIVGIGGNGDIGFGLTLDWLSRDPGTGTIVLDIRRLKDHRVFLSAARAAARLRTVVAIRAGGRLLDPSGGADLTFEAALRRAGVLAVTRLEDVLAAAETLSRARPVRTETLAIVGNALGPGRLAADAVLRHGLRLPEHLQEGVVTIPPGQPDALATTAAAEMARPEVGGVLVVHAPAGPRDEETMERLIGIAKGQRTPLLVCAMGETTGALHRIRLAQAGLPVFSGPEQAVRGFVHLVQDRRNRAAARELPPRTVLALAPDRTAVSRLFAAVRASGRLALMQDEALQVLAAYGIPVTAGRVVGSPEDAAAAATLLGFPAVLKLRQAVQPAARPASGLSLDLNDAAEVAAAARVLAGRAARRGVTADLLVQPQVGRARELAIRVADDPTFGPTIRFGQGGTTPEDGRAVAIDLPPLNLTLAQAMIGRSRAGAQLESALRDRPAAQRGQVAEVLVRISQLVVDFPEIAGLEAGSLFADAQGVVAADAWIALRPAGAPGVRLAIAPYPAELIEHWEAKGERFTIRPIRPEDAEQHGAFFKRLSPEDIRYRFFSAIRELSAEQMARLTQVDYDREMAFVAIHEATGDTVGISRLVCELDQRTGEFAVIVQADMKGRGLARHLMRRLIAWATAHGLSEVVGQVLADNAPMLAFVRHLGFTVRRMPEDPEVMEARLSLPSA
ncbi:MAG: bifunctional acetate--CoA ligase family protein/GNAT family N-acetyltransferase [Rhodospirillales bacterium]|nr:bifunctional acetate--CoA ligase family protein/GNAT family N-acetyltransferase [Rhodospirillales bacterium]